MNGYGRHVAAISVGFAAVFVGSLAIAAVIDSDGGDEVFLEAFAMALGVSLILFGVATAVAAIATYLTGRR